MTDIFTRFWMQDGDAISTQGVPFPATLRGYPFADDDEIEALLDALHLLDDGALRITVDALDLDSGPIDFTGYTPPILDTDGGELEPERWDFAGPRAVSNALQETLGPRVMVEWVDAARAFRITSASTGWDARMSYARAPMGGTDISALLRLARTSDASLVEGRVVTSGGGTTQGIMYPSGDWVFEPPDLVNDEGLETAVVLSLFTWALAAKDDVLPGITEDDRQGWWAQPWGSKLWLLSREKWTEEVKTRAEYYARMALQWMIEDQVADRVETEARLMEVGTIAIAVAIYRDGRLLFAKPYGLLWQSTVSYAPAIARQ